jgi:hypothetical protein
MIYIIPFPSGHLYRNHRFVSGEHDFEFVKTEQERIRAADEVHVIATLRDAAEIFHLKLMTSALDSLGAREKRFLFLPYLPYGKSIDQIEGHSHGIKDFGDVINLLNYESVCSFDTYSPAAFDYISNLTNIPAEPLIRKALMQISGPTVVLFPEARTVPRYDIRECPFLYCNKSYGRGEERIFEVPKREEFGDCENILLVINACHSGSSEIKIAESLKNHGLKLHLYASHGFFSHGTEVLLKHYHQIFTSSSVATPKKDTHLTVFSWYNV